MKVLPFSPKLQARSDRPAEGRSAASPARKADLIRLSPDGGYFSRMSLEEAAALLGQTAGQISQAKSDRLGRLHHLDGDQAATLLSPR